MTRNINNNPAEIPHSQMTIQLEPIKENENSPVKHSKIPENGNFDAPNELLSQSQVVSERQNATGNIQSNPNLNCSNEEVISEGDNNLSSDATLSALNRKSEKLRNALEKTIEWHKNTDPSQRVERIKEILSTLNEREWRSFYNSVMESFNIDLSFFNTGVSVQSQNRQLLSLTCLSPSIIEKFYMDLDMKSLIRELNQISSEAPSFPLNIAFHKNTKSASSHSEYNGRTSNGRNLDPSQQSYHHSQPRDRHSGGGYNNYGYGHSSGNSNHRSKQYYIGKEKSGNPHMYNEMSKNSNHFSNRHGPKHHSQNSEHQYYSPNNGMHMGEAHERYRESGRSQHRGLDQGLTREKM